MPVAISILLETKCQYALYFVWTGFMEDMTILQSSSDWVAFATVIVNHLFQMMSLH